MDGVLLSAGNVLGRVKEGSTLDEDTVELVVRLLKAPAESLGIRVLALSNYTRVMGARPRARCGVCISRPIRHARTAMSHVKECIRICIRVWAAPI